MDQNLNQKTIFAGVFGFFCQLNSETRKNITKVGASYQWPFRPNSAGSKEKTTIGMTHPTLHLRRKIEKPFRAYRFGLAHGK